MGEVQGWFRLKEMENELDGWDECKVWHGECRIEIKNYNSIS